MERLTDQIIIGEEMNPESNYNVENEGEEINKKQSSES
jgi:hypothetical protein